MTGRIFEDPDLGKILTSSKDEIQKFLRLRQLDLVDSFLSFFLFFNKNVINWNSHYIFSGKKISDLQKLRCE